MTLLKEVRPRLPANLEAQRCPVSRAAAPQRILIARFGALGDILMTTPLLTALRRSHPDAHITWLVEEKNVCAVDANPYVDAVLLWNSGAWSLMQSTRPRNWINNRLGFQWLVNQLRLRRQLRRRFDLFISFHPERWQFLMNAAAPPASIGIFESPSQAKRDYTSRYSKAYTAGDFQVHQTDTYLLPLKALGLPPAGDKRMVIGYTAEDAQTVDRLLEEQHLQSGFVVLAPQTTWASKCWPEASWSALGDALAREQRRIVLIGSAAESASLKRIAASMQSPPVILAGTLSFRELAALLARASVCVSSDSGPMHLASAVGTPIVSLFGSTAPAQYAPLVGVRHVLIHPVPCGPCRKQVCPNPPASQMNCLRLLTIAEVRDAVLSLLVCETPS